MADPPFPTGQYKVMDPAGFEVKTYDPNFHTRVLPQGKIFEVAQAGQTTPVIVGSYTETDSNRTAHIPIMFGRHLADAAAPALPKIERIPRRSRRTRRNRSTRRKSRRNRRV